MFAVEEGIPIPEIEKSDNRDVNSHLWITTGGCRVYPFDQMKVGGSLFVPCVTKEELDYVHSKVNKAARTYGRNHEKKYITRNIKIAGPMGVRC